jgi:hypothetical protein
LHPALNETREGSINFSTPYNSREFCDECEEILKIEKEKKEEEIKLLKWNEKKEKVRTFMLSKLRDIKFGKYVSRKCLSCFETGMFKNFTCNMDCFKETCIHCEHYKNGYCRRYPEPIKVSEDDKCGEYLTHNNIRSFLFSVELEWYNGSTGDISLCEELIGNWYLK